MKVCSKCRKRYSDFKNRCPKCDMNLDPYVDLADKADFPSRFFRVVAKIVLLAGILLGFIFGHAFKIEVVSRYDNAFNTALMFQTWGVAISAFLGLLAVHYHFKNQEKMIHGIEAIFSCVNHEE